MAEGTYSWTVNCTDAAGNTGTVTEKTIYIDVTQPFINLSGPENSGNFDYTTIQFNFTATDNMDANLSITILL